MPIICDSSGMDDLRSHYSFTKDCIIEITQINHFNDIVIRLSVLQGQFCTTRRYSKKTYKLGKTYVVSTNCMLNFYDKQVKLQERSFSIFNKLN